MEDALHPKIPQLNKFRPKIHSIHLIQNRHNGNVDNCRKNITLSYPPQKAVNLKDISEKK